MDTNSLRTMDAFASPWRPPPNAAVYKRSTGYMTTVRSKTGDESMITWNHGDTYLVMASVGRGMPVVEDAVPLVVLVARSASVVFKGEILPYLQTPSTTAKVNGVIHTRDVTVTLRSKARAVVRNILDIAAP